MKGESKEEFMVGIAIGLWVGDDPGVVFWTGVEGACSCTCWVEDPGAVYAGGLSASSEADGPMASNGFCFFSSAMVC